MLLLLSYSRKQNLFSQVGDGTSAGLSFYVLMYVWTAGDYSINPFFLSLILKDFQLPLACFIYDQVLAIRNVIFNKMKCMCLMERSINHAESNQYTFISFCHNATLHFYRLIMICKKYVNIFSEKWSPSMHCESKSMFSSHFYSGSRPIQCPFTSAFLLGISIILQVVDSKLRHEVP